ncbi:MAG: type IV pilus assembly protein PilM [Patescibacteria group bacterium]|nr:type IV pilus assembly protein PilM [Patescibacteria group bacterium]
MFNIFSNSSTGIEISDSFIKLISLKKKLKTIYLEGYNKIILPPNIVVDGEIKDVDSLIKYIIKSVKTIKGNKKIKGNIVTSSSNRKTFTVLIKMKQKISKNKDDDQKSTQEAILEEIKKEIPFLIEDIYFDWQYACTKNSNEQKKILLSAAPKTIIDDYINAFKTSELFLNAIDIKAAAIIRSLIPIKNKQIKIIIYIGEFHSTIILGNNNIIEFVVNTPLTSDAINKTIADKLNLSKSQTEKAKKICGVNDKKCHGALKKALDPLINKLTNDVKNILLSRKDDSENQFPIEKIILCGKGANLKNLDELVEKKLNIKTIVGNPLINIKKTNNLLNQEKALEFATTIGMALRGIL